MEKDIQKLTQNERYDLKRKQLKEEWNKITQEDIIKNYREVNAEQDYKIRMLETENQRLKAQLDREIHINRKMKKALEKYIEVGYLEVASRPMLVCDNPSIDMGLFAREALKQIEEME